MGGVVSGFRLVGVTKALGTKGSREGDKWNYFIFLHDLNILKEM